MDTSLLRMEASALERWAQRCIHCFAPLQEQENRVLPLVIVSCRGRFPDLPTDTIREVVRHLWNRYLHRSKRSLK
jgi:hypothetical protein